MKELTALLALVLTLGLFMPLANADPMNVYDNPAYLLTAFSDMDGSMPAAANDGIPGDWAWCAGDSGGLTDSYPGGGWIVDPPVAGMVPVLWRNGLGLRMALVTDCAGHQQPPSGYTAPADPTKI